MKALMNTSVLEDIYPTLAQVMDTLPRADALTLEGRISRADAYYVKTRDEAPLQTAASPYPELAAELEKQLAIRVL